MSARLELRGGQGELAGKRRDARSPPSRWPKKEPQSPRGVNHGRRLAGVAHHRTLREEHVRVEGRKTWFETVEKMPPVLDTRLDGYNQRRPHQGRGMKGGTPARAFVDGLPSATPTTPPKKKEKTNPDTQPQHTAI